MVRAEHRIGCSLNPELAREYEADNHQSRSSLYTATVLNSMAVNKEKVETMIADLYGRDSSFLFWDDRSTQYGEDKRFLMPPRISSLIRREVKSGVIGKWAVVVLDSSWKYSGHVFLWSRRGDAKIIGIRSSLSNTLPSISQKLLRGVAQWASERKLGRVVVSSPLAHMKEKVLPKLGFKDEEGEDCNMVSDTIPLLSLPREISYTEYLRGNDLAPKLEKLIESKAFLSDVKLYARHHKVTMVAAYNHLKIVTIDNCTSWLACDVINYLFHSALTDD